MAGYEERGVRARVAAHCAQLAGYRRSLCDTEPMRYGTYTAMQLCSYAACYSRQLCNPMQSTLRYAAVMSTPHSVPLRSKAT